MDYSRELLKVAKNLKASNLLTKYDAFDYGMFLKDLGLLIKKPQLQIDFDYKYGNISLFNENKTNIELSFYNEKENDTILMRVFLNGKKILDRVKFDKTKSVDDVADFIVNDVYKKTYFLV